MAFSPAFSLSNNASVSQSTFTLTDTSTGSDPAINSRQVFIYDAANNLLPNTPISFPLISGNSISPQILDKDYAVSVTVNWLNSLSQVIYTSSQIFVFTGYLEWFDYGLVQAIAGKNRIMNDDQYWANLSRLRVLIDNATNAINLGFSVYNAQNMLNEAQFMMNNKTLYF